MTVFDQTDYKAVLKEQIRRNDEIYGYKSKLAQAAGCQASFLSRVLNGKDDLTPDHACGLADFFGYTGDEKDYFLELVHHARARSRAMREYLKGRLDRLRDQHRKKTVTAFSAPTTTGEEQAAFYASWHNAAVAMSLQIPSLRSAETIATRLLLPKAVVEESLSLLERMGLARRSGRHWEPTSPGFTTKNPLYSAMHFSNWAHRAALDAFRPDRPDTVRTVSVSTATMAECERMLSMTTKFLDDRRRLFEPAKSEELFYFSLYFGKL